ncbi:related to RKM1 - SET-domain lysine-N-methyltransferase [Ustilago trichophora]|uniref:Related to RKM1 - SET-domain lysine-N-methyltransferase n=1 Tax=Ustilago trichophora TaxID=86804 RepID=A0A5C3E2Y3_9BASI|nr:related to RKM1 - SET-domain lysine-N-methyltransferase [Ustilago trichophora]
MSPKHPLLQWFTSVGVKIHPDLYLEQDPVTGLSFYTAQPLPRDTTVIRVPKELCITSTSALEQVQLILRNVGGTEAVLEPSSLPAPDWILLYLVLSRLAEEYLTLASEDAEEVERVFVHLPYVSHIPKIIETPLHFSPVELSLLANTPLVGSTERRLRETIVDYERASLLIARQLQQASAPHTFVAYLCKALKPITLEQPEHDPLMSQTYHKGLELWRWAESAFTSRSFPPRLIGLSDHRDACSSSGTATSAPILIPAYDTFNHARAHPVTWSYSPATPEMGDMVCMTLNYDSPSAPCQVYNNYGGKSNEEFLSGYGFTLDTVTEDTLALKLGTEGNGTDQTEAKTHYWIVPSESTSEIQLKSEQDTADGFVKDKCPCPSLLSELERRVLEGDEPPTTLEDQLYLYASVLETLESLLLSKRKAFRTSQKQIEALHTDLTSVDEAAQTADGWHRNALAADIGNTSSFRSSVWNNVMQYRRGQLHLLNHAVDWTRAELGRVADALDALDALEDDQDAQ